MPNFWHGKRILIIGGAGFVGLHLTDELIRQGAKVTILDNLSRSGTKSFIPAGATFIYGDCSNEGTCRDTFKNQDYIVNLAAWVAGVDYNQRNQAEMYYRNWLAQMTPLRIAHEYGIERFLSVSSVCVYAPGFNAPCREFDGFEGKPTPANFGYSLAKRAGERMALWYADAGLHDAGLHTVRVRPSNIYGIGDYFDERAHVVPALIRKAFKNEQIVVNGSGQERREFLYVTDAAAGMMAALQHGKRGAVYNLGTNGETSVTISELARLIRIDAGCPEKPIVFEHQFDSGDNVRWSLARLALDELNWQYTVGIEAGIEKTVEFYANHRDD